VELDQYQVSAFSQRPFGGNPAAVVPLAQWLPGGLMQAIAAENNLSETAFFVAEGAGYGLRWFTPTVEVDLCGHATLATAHVLYHELGNTEPEIVFMTRSGELRVARTDQGIRLDLPAQSVVPAALDPAICAALGGDPQTAFAAKSPMYLYGSEAQVRALQPDMRALTAASASPVIVTAAGDTVDFVSRFFGPQVGIEEDPVTGSAHCALTPFWAQRLGSDRLQAHQVSARQGELLCELAAERVLLSGHALTFLRGRISLEVS
jgi:predicted PhzF superfamily epimerase YddE/YHI9